MQTLKKASVMIIAMVLLLQTLIVVYTPKANAGPNFSASITPVHVAGDKSYVFTITVTNNGSAIGITKIMIATNETWTFNALVDYSPSTWTTINWTYSGGTAFNMTGPNLVIGQSAVLKVNMTTPDNTRDPAYWNVMAFDAGGASLGTIALAVVVDNVKPNITIEYPKANDYYSVGSGNYIWINGTVSDNLNITKYGMPTKGINGTFALYSFIKDTDLRYKFCFRNTTAIQDGLITIKVTFGDKAGNTNSTTVKFTVDTKAPTLIMKVYDDKVGELKNIGNTYYMSKNASKIAFTITYFNPAGVSTKKIYLNGTGYDIYNATWTPSGNFSVSTVNLVVVNNITLIDKAFPTNNTAVFGPYYIVRDTVKPSVPAWESYTVIKGGVVIKGLTATDNVAVDELKVYNGTQLFTTIPIDKLGSLTLWSDANKNVFVFKDYVILNLTASLGKTLSIKIAAVDYAQNTGDNSTTISLLVEGYFYPLELKKGWNLISFPIIPESTAYDTIKTWFLAGKLKYVYGYDPASGWVLNPSMTHGVGYWVYVEDYDVLLVRGSTTELPLPPAVPVSYELKKGWNLVGYTSIYVRNATEYLGSLEQYSYYKYIYIWNAEKQAWTMKDATSNSTKLAPGTAFWIYMYKDQTLVPPVP